jgi:hypothetical protein
MSYPGLYPSSEERGDSIQSKKGLMDLIDLSETGTSGSVCVNIRSIAGPFTSRNGWKHRRMAIQDASIEAEMLISETQFEEWKFKTGDHLVCDVRSSGVDKEGKLTLFFNSFLGPFEVSRILFEMNAIVRKLETSRRDHMKPSETVYQISAREARSLLILVRLWVEESKPQHYTKWCQMHQIVATNLYYMGLVDRTGSMSGYYYPTKDALEFFEGKKLIAKKRVFTKGKNGQHVLRGEEGEKKAFSEYLEDYSDRETALKEYSEALETYRSKLKPETT